MSTVTAQWAQDACINDDTRYSEVLEFEHAGREHELQVQRDPARFDEGMDEAEIRGAVEEWNAWTAQGFRLRLVSWDPTTDTAVLEVQP